MTKLAKADMGSSSSQIAAPGHTVVKSDLHSGDDLKCDMDKSGNVWSGNARKHGVGANG